jgi:RNA polymerase sporulation-specific sigma factor
MSLNNQECDLEFIIRIKRSADPVAKEDLVRKYLPMVKHIVRKNINPAPGDYEDLLQEGVIGLLKAINKYNHELYSIKFSTFAYICILRKIYNARRQIWNTGNRLAQEATSFYQELAPEDSRVLLDLIDDSTFDPERIIEEKLTCLRLAEVLKAHLSPVEYLVFFLYLQGLSCREIQQKLGIKAKVVDNAKTRARLKLQRVIKRYGSLLNPEIPLKTRKRRDLSLKIIS